MPIVYAQMSWQEPVDTSTNAGIELDGWCLTTWWCKLNVYQTLGIRESTGGENSAEIFVQDIFLSATFFVGTLATIGLLISWVKMIYGGADESQFEAGKKWLKYSIIGILLVILSYTIIRVVEFVAQGQR